MTLAELRSLLDSHLLAAHFDVIEVDGSIYLLALTELGCGWVRELRESLRQSEARSADEDEERGA